MGFAAEISSILDINGNVSKILTSEYIQSIEPYIQQYPPKFLSKDQELQIRRSAELVVKQIESLAPQSLTDQDILIDLGWILAMAYNLDILSTEDFPREYFQRALTINKENRRGNYLMGMFLASTHKYHWESIPYLEKALQLGEEDARYTLGLLFVQKGKNKEGIDYLKTYSKKYPDNEHVKNVIKTIEEGKLQFKAN